MNSTKIEYENKIQEFFINDLKKIQNPQIIEFGVRFGVSTKKIIEVCEKNNGFLNAVDILDCAEISNSTKWKFHKCRDDNFEYLDKVLPRQVDLIYLDSFHNANHIEKIILHYFEFLKKDGIFIVDDISWLPYLKNKKRNNFNCEINNFETFNKLLKLKAENENLFDLYFSFVGSGLAKIVKKENFKINKSKSLNLRFFSIKNLIRKLYYLFTNK